MSDLKPCPYCGGDAEIWRASGGLTAWVACMSRCAVLVSKEHTTDAEAIAAWNTRATPDLLSDPRMKALVELLREANADLKAYVNTDWPERMRNQYPDMQRKWKRDMLLCRRIDAALRAIEEGGE